jgi:hypothetical protein
MARRDGRTLGLWTAAWLAGFLVAGLLWLGDLSLQWPVLLIPLLWALVALRTPRPRRIEHGDEIAMGRRTDTVERPALRRPERPGEWR